MADNRAAVIGSPTSFDTAVAGEPVPPPTPSAAVPERQVGVARQRPRRLRVQRIALRITGPILAIGAWQLACTFGVFTKVEVASPADVLRAAHQLSADGTLQANLAISLQRVAEGLFIGILTGAALAIACGLSQPVEDLVDPVIQAVRAVPILGLVPLAIIWFGVGETPKVFLVALGCTFPIYLNTFAAIRGVDLKLIEAGRAFGLNRWGLIRRIILPGTLPGFFTGLRFALVGSWLIIIVAEEINAQRGIGYLIMQAQTTDRTDIMFLGLAVYAVLGLLADAFVRLLERRMLAWRRGFDGT